MLKTKQPSGIAGTQYKKSMCHKIIHERFSNRVLKHTHTYIYKERKSKKKHKVEAKKKNNSQQGNSRME